MFISRAENVTPQRIGGRVTATKRGSATRPDARLTMAGAQTPNMPRIQVTICGAPNTTAMPTIAAIGQPHEIRFAMAMIPSAITRMTAIGVAHARMLLWRDVAPVRNGEAWASARSGVAATNRISSPKVQFLRISDPSVLMIYPRSSGSLSLHRGEQASNLSAEARAFMGAQAQFEGGEPKWGQNWPKPPACGACVSTESPTNSRGCLAARPNFRLPDLTGEDTVQLLGGGCRLFRSIGLFRGAYELDFQSARRRGRSPPANGCRPRATSVLVDGRPGTLARFAGDSGTHNLLGSKRDCLARRACQSDV